MPLFSHRPNIVYVASNHFVWRLVPVSISSQIQQLLQDKQFELALQLAVSCPSPPDLLQGPGAASACVALKPFLWLEALRAVSWCLTQLLSCGAVR